MLKIGWGPFLNAAQNPNRFHPFQLDFPLVNSLQLTIDLRGKIRGKMRINILKIMDIY